MERCAQGLIESINGKSEQGLIDRVINRRDVKSLINKSINEKCV